MAEENPPGLPVRLAAWAAHHRDGALWTLVVGGFILVIAYRKDPVVMVLGWAAILIGALILILPPLLGTDQRARRHAALLAAVISAAAAIVGFWLVENAYFVPSLGLISVLLFLGHFLTSPAVLRLRVGLRTRRPVLATALVIITGAVLMIALAWGWWISVGKSKERVARAALLSKLLPAADETGSRFPAPKMSATPTAPLAPPQMATVESATEAAKEPLRRRGKQSSRVVAPPAPTKPQENPKPEASKRPEVTVVYQDHKLFIYNTADAAVTLRATSFDGGPVEVAPRIIPKSSHYYIYTDKLEALLATELSHPGSFQKEWDLYLIAQDGKEEFVAKWLLVFRVDEHGWRIDTQNIAVNSATAAQAPAEPQSNPKLETPAELPDISLVFVYPQAISVLIVNTSNVLLRDPKYFMVIWDLDIEGRTDPLPIPAVTLTGEWIWPHTAIGPNQVITQPQVAPLVKRGDHLMGCATVDCLTCGNAKGYWIYAIYGEGGWFAETKPKGQWPSWVAVFKLLPEIRKNPEHFFSDIPQADRIKIGDFN
jgi:hypothetical protein